MLRTIKYFKDLTPTTPPPLWLTPLEGGRCAAEILSFMASRKLLARDHESDGHPVLVLPGLFASDRTTRWLQEHLAELGYDVYGWDLGVNFGPSRKYDIEALVRKRVDEIYQSSGERKISLIGWSLGGLYARLIAHRMPEQVRQVMTLGSPINGSPEMTSIYRVYEWFSGRSIKDESNLTLLQEAQSPLPVPGTAIYSKTDAVVAWQISRIEGAEHEQNVHVHASHVGMVFNPAVIHVIQDRLSQAEDDWQFFEPGPLSRLMCNAA
jgi:pimeloyl-ACP methyl ester carboxylesterase